MIETLSILLIGSFAIASASQGVDLTISTGFVYECQSFTLTATFFGTGVPTKYIFKNLNSNLEVEVFPPQTSITIEADVNKHSGQWQVSAFGVWGVLVSSQASILVKTSRTTFTVGCDDRQYVYSSCQKTHSEAQQWCTDKGMTLASPGDHIEGSAIKNALKYTVYQREMWADVTRTSSVSPWKHCNSDVGFFSERMKSGSGNCASYHYYYKRFYPRSCVYKKSFLCQKAECDLKLPNILYPSATPSKRYVVVTRPRNFVEAKAYCENMQFRLMSIQAMSQMMSVCFPLISNHMSTTAFVMGPRYDVNFGNFTDTCDNPIPDNIWPIVMDDPEYSNVPITNKCMVLLNDLSYVHPCDKCQPGFVCENNLIGPNCP